MEDEIIGSVRSAFSDALVSLFVVGSYATYDIVDGYSDYDLLAFVADPTRTPKNINFEKLSAKYSVALKCTVRPIADLQNRILGNDRATRFIGNLDLLDLKLRARLLYGKNIADDIPEVHELLKRDLRSELRAEYAHATDPDPVKNIFVREPQDWCNYIINMSGAILLSGGVTGNKNLFPELLQSYHPDFKGISSLEEALALRSSKIILHLDRQQRDDFKITLGSFLDEYRRYVFNQRDVK